MNSFLSQIVNAAAWAKANWGQILAAWAALIAGASVFVRALQAFVDCFERIWPGISKADTFFGKVLAGLAWLSHVKLFNIFALTPQPEHAAAAYKRPGDVTTGQKLISSVVSKEDALGSSKIVPLLIMTALAVGPGTISCAHISPLAQQLLDCGSVAVQQQLPNLVSQVNGILQSSSVNWQDALDALLATAGSTVVCAVQQVVADLEKGSSTSALGQASIVSIARGEAWLTNHPNLVAPAK